MEEEGEQDRGGGDRYGVRWQLKALLILVNCPRPFRPGQSLTSGVGPQPNASVSPTLDVLRGPGWGTACLNQKGGSQVEAGIRRLRSLSTLEHMGWVGCRVWGNLSTTCHLHWPWVEWQVGRQSATCCFKSPNQQWLSLALVPVLTYR